MDEGKCLNSKEIYNGKVVRLTVDQVKIPDGREIELEVCNLSGAAAVVPVDEQGRAVLVRQYRYATGGWILEVPAGKMDPGEEPETCALREVTEETGCRPSKLVPMGFIFTGPGFTNEKIWLYLATDLTEVGQHLDHDELLRVERLDLDRAVSMAHSGEIEDAKSVCALLRAEHFLSSP